MSNRETQLTILVDTTDSEAVLRELRLLARLMAPEVDLEPVDRVYEHVLTVFEGKDSHYRHCNTDYHDLQHTMDVLLAMGRLMHGAAVTDTAFTGREVALSILAGLLHDTGYLQTADDRTGTGAKYTQIHVDRSIAFMRDYFDHHGFDQADVADCRMLIDCTRLATDVTQLEFRSTNMKLLGQMLGSADLLGQMADRTYLEKLLFLYYEFKEGGIGDYASELELLEKTVGFYQMTAKRLEVTLGNVQHYMAAHFQKRWDIDDDLYHLAIQRNLDYLHYILENHRSRYRDQLRRGNVVKRLEERERQEEG